MILQGIAASDGVGLGRAVCVREMSLDYSNVRCSGRETAGTMPRSTNAP